MSSVAGGVFFSSLCLFTFGLGVWQTQRYFEKVDMVHQRLVDLNLPPLNSLADWQQQHQTSVKSYRRVVLQGKFLHQHQLLIGPRGPPTGALATTGPNSGRGGGMSSSAQGYFVITPFSVCVQQDNSVGESPATKSWWNKLLSFGGGNSTNVDQTMTNMRETVVWINRGWIPRHFERKQSNLQNESIPTQPSGIVTLLVMESAVETPGRFSPPSRLNQRKNTESNGDAGPGKGITDDGIEIPRLLWMDRDAIEELAHCPKDSHPPLFLQIKDMDHEDQSSIQYPVQPTQEHVGEFKVTPEIHAGYALTWFGLSGAGIIMTRKLLTRGR